MSDDKTGKLIDALQTHEASRQLGYEQGLDRAILMVDDEIRETEKDKQYIDRNPGDPEALTRWSAKLDALKRVRGLLAEARREASPNRPPLPKA